jgi:hypothetical protein
LIGELLEMCECIVKEQTAESTTELDELGELLGCLTPSLGATLSNHRHHELLDESDFTFRRGSIMAKVAGLEPELGESIYGPSDLDLRRREVPLSSDHDTGDEPVTNHLVDAGRARTSQARYLIGRKELWPTRRYRHPRGDGGIYRLMGFQLLGEEINSRGIGIKVLFDLSQGHIGRLL